jgi:transcriptional regulator of heat shock response
MRETGKLLSELTGTVAVVLAPRAETLVLHHLRFIRTSTDEVLAVLVMKNGTVQNRFLSATMSEPELQRIHNLLDDVVEGGRSATSASSSSVVCRASGCSTTICGAPPSPSAERP